MSRIKRKQKGVTQQKHLKNVLKNTKWVIQGLTFSVALNVALLTTLVFNSVKAKREGKGHVKENQWVSKKNAPLSLTDLAHLYQGKNYQELVEMLEDETPLEEGYLTRDLALSVLYQKFDLDVERALLGQGIPVRHIPISDTANSEPFVLISDLTDQQYGLIQNFIQNERWPLTSHGLFKRLLQHPEDESLKSAFYLSKEFMYIDALFCSLSISKEVLLDILLSGEWKIISNFVENFHGTQDFSNPLRINFLSSYLELGSNLAAKLILEIDAQYALKKLSDSQVVALLSLMEQKTNLSENFALHLAIGNRKDWVRKEACRLLYHYSNKELPEPYSYQDAIGFLTQKYQIHPIETFAPAASFTVEEKEYIASSEAHKIYVVQEGDNLWKIAKKHKVGLEDLKELNHLNSDLIKVGMTLVIP